MFQNSSYHLHPVAPFVKLTTHFEKDVIKAIYAGHTLPQDPTIPNLVKKYGHEVSNLAPPDAVIPLLETYKLNVLDIFNPVT